MRFCSATYLAPGIIRRGSVCFALFRNRECYEPGSVRFSDVVNHTVRFGYICISCIYFMPCRAIRCGAVYKRPKSYGPAAEPNRTEPMGKQRGSFFFFFFHTQFYFPASGQAVVTGVVPSSPRFLTSIFIAHRVQQSLLIVDFASRVADSRSRAIRKPICAQEKSPNKFMQVCTRRGSNSRN